MPGGEKTDIAIVGAGIVGTAIAFRLSQRGKKVLLVDRDKPGRGCSFGNAGHIATEQIFPLPSLSTLLDVPKLMLRHDRPLSVRGGYLWQSIPWLARFVRAARNRAFHNGVAALSSLLRAALPSLQSLSDDAGIGHLLRQGGHLLVVEREGSRQAARVQMEQLQRHGVPVQWLDTPSVLARAPTLKTDIAGALLFSGSGQVSNPHGFCLGLCNAFLAGKGRFLKAQVERIETLGEAGFRLHLDSQPLLADRVVIAAGAWSKDLAAQLGFRVPLDTERGYHLHASGYRAEFDLPIASFERRVIMTPMDDGLRIVGFVEFGGLKLPPVERRFEVLARHLRELLPPARLPEYTRWMGFRPSLPDHLPIIAASPRNPNAYFAFGHQHLGLTLSGITADLVAAMICGDKPRLDTRPFRIERFGQ